MTEKQCKKMEQLIPLLREVQNVCTESNTCNKCPFDGKEHGCRINDPNFWYIPEQDEDGGT